MGINKEEITLKQLTDEDIPLFESWLDKEYIKKWVMAGPTHHYALGVGHHADTIAKIAEVLHIDYEIIKS